MARARIWFVESKEFEMLIKGGNHGLRIEERSKKKQCSVFIQRDEVVWMVGAVEKAMDVETSEVYWDPSSAGFPRVLVQRRANRHGRFIIIEEFEGNKRRGSVLIPEGRYGQGWSRLTSELRAARMSLWKGRDFRERKATVVVAGKTYAEVVGGPELLENEAKVASPEKMEGSSPAKVDDGGVQCKTQRRPANNTKGGSDGGAPEKTQSQAPVESSGVPEKSQAQVGGSVRLTTTNLSKSLQNPVFLGEAALKGGFESVKDGRSSVYGCEDLHDISVYLMDIKGQLELGIKRVEMVFQLMEQRKCRGCVEKASEMGLGLGSPRVLQKRGIEEVDWVKPKKKNFKWKNKTQQGVLGPKPEGSFGLKSNKKPAQVCHKPGSFINNLDPKPSCKTAQKPQSTGSIQIRNQWSGFTKTLPFRNQDRRPVQQVGQVGESSAMGAARSTGEADLAGESSGERVVAVGALSVDSLGSTGEADLAGEHSGGTGLPEKRSSASGAPDSEDVEGPGHLIPSPTLLLTTIPESSDLDNASTLSVKRYKGMSDCIELADEGEINICMPEKQSKQMKVFQRRESPSAKVTKSWVAERVVWNGDHEFAATGKNLNECLDSVGQTACVDSDPGVQELGCLGGMGSQEEENTIIEGSISQCNTEDFPEAFEEQGLDLGSPASKDLKWAWAVKGTAGLTCGGQERKLVQVFGQIVADKYGGGTSYPTGMVADDNRGMGDEDVPYEA
jgi:hypothetical protein